jgi:hypothetical protein
MSLRATVQSTFVWCVVLLQCLAISAALSLPTRSDEPAESQASRAAVNAWVNAKGLQNGINRDADLFVGQGSGRHRLECLVEAIGELSQHLNTDVASGDKEGVIVLRSQMTARGYGIVHETYLVGDPDSIRADSSERAESITLVQRNGEMLCVNCSVADETGYSRFSYPSFDEDRRKALEDELMEAFVKESFTYTFQDGETVRCVFVIDCGPRR